MLIDFNKSYIYNYLYVYIRFIFGLMKKNEIIVAVLGSNLFNDYSLFEEVLYEKLERYFEDDYKIILREQESNTTDNFTIKFSKENNCSLERYKIQWEKLGKVAGIENIKKMIWGDNANAGADFLFVFQNKWDSNKDRYIINNIIKEFNSILSIEFEEKCFIFTI